MRGAGWARVTHPFATLCTPEGVLSVRLACVKHAASVHPEPGSNSPFEYGAGTAALPGKPDSALPRSWRPHRGGRRAAGRSIVVIKATSMTHRISSKNSVFRSIRFSRSRLRPGGASAAPHSRAARGSILRTSPRPVKRFRQLFLKNFSLRGPPCPFSLRCLAFYLFKRASPYFAPVNPPSWGFVFVESPPRSATASSPLRASKLLCCGGGFSISLYMSL